MYTCKCVRVYVSARTHIHTVICAMLKYGPAEHDQKSYMSAVQHYIHTCMQAQRYQVYVCGCPHVPAPLVHAKCAELCTHMLCMSNEHKVQ